MFRAANNLTHVSGIDFSNMEDVNSMFYQCSIQELDFEFNMPKATNVSSMFGQNTKLSKDWNY